MSIGATVRAWRPRVDGVVEVLHAHFPSHAYPSHTHDAWTVLIVDEGAVRYDLDRHEHGLAQAQVSLLPPHVPHDGRSVLPQGFRKRVLYLDPGRLGGTNLIGAAVDQPEYVDPLLRHRIHQLHGVLESGVEDLEAQSRLTLIEERLGQHLRRQVVAPPDRSDSGVAAQLRDLLDAHVPDGIKLEDAAKLVHAHPAHLVRAFSREYGMPPHRYLTGRRVDLARRYLLDGHPAAEVATLAGFYDQSHLNRHFRKLLGVTPASFVRS
ncbi:AraC family transcriptional regulator [Kribbella pratensis]|jgi:AraC-like DNA-binding protein|uniref:AraC family transcriptional regulator n=1 Tax=Kribbella pratensis TaxID=2512112 RepID=A0ABY2F4D2_9ACTN|nr:AraC family transcriptional regulator [Kribbella pratensis]TDW79702.1 AraC family transcriptional regulator [Kribbella pratensis]